MKKGFHYYKWPLIILAFIAFGAGLSTWTLTKAFNAPVQMADDYMMDYQQVDMHIEDILDSKAKFDAKYRIDIERKKLKLATPQSVVIKVIDKASNTTVDNAQLDVVVTRPFTKENDVWFKGLKAQNGEYTVGPFKLQAPGRWQVFARATKDDMTGFKKVEYKAK
jgi:hypothetical protein